MWEVKTEWIILGLMRTCNDRTETVIFLVCKLDLDKFTDQDWFLACTLSCLSTIPQIHLWCDTCWLYRDQHGGRAFLIHVPADMSTSTGGSGLEPTTVLAARSKHGAVKHSATPARLLSYDSCKFHRYCHNTSIRKSRITYLIMQTNDKLETPGNKSRLNEAHPANSYHWIADVMIFNKANYLKAAGNFLDQWRHLDAIC